MNYPRLSFLLIALIALSGCVQTRAYLAERERVDQDIPGIHAPEKPKTRQVMVVEVIDKNKDLPPATALPASEIKKITSDGQSKVVTALKDTVVVHEGNFTFPEMSSDTLTQGAPLKPPALTVPARYKVTKDDTLQKISKKLYGTFSKWTKIYDANKDVIKDPNFLKPGIELNIPSTD